jgi:hypothetical protein
MPGHTIVGSGSLMPVSAYLKKMETTCMYEDPEMMNNYYRSALKDLRPDKPFFESDMPRRRTYSEDRINLRLGGARSLMKPDLPDGTFLDHEFLNPDPRGHTNMPNMRKFAEQNKIRLSRTKFSSDADNSIPGEGRHPATLIKDKDKLFNETKYRLKIFDESMDGRTNGLAPVSKNTSVKKCLQNTTERKPMMREAMCYNNAGYVHNLSNSVPIGWRRTTDHRFKISKYGQHRPGPNENHKSTYKNRANAKISHDVLLSWKDKNVPKQLLVKMIDSLREKQRRIESGGTLMFSRSKDNKTRQQKLSPNDLLKIKQNEEETQSTNPNILLKGEIQNYKQQQKTTENKMDKTIIDPHIIEFMTQANRKLSKKEMNDLREQIKQSGEYNEVLVEQNNNKQNIQEQTNKLLWDSKANYYKGQSKKLANYASKFNSDIEKNRDSINPEKYKKQSQKTQQRRGELVNTLYNFDAVDFDNDYGRETSNYHMIGPLGSKFTRNYIETENGTNDDLSDITAGTNKNTQN